MSIRPSPVVLIILDGFGHRTNPEHNAIHAAHTPVYDALLQSAPHGLIEASGMAVGLPDGQMGNSEVGHMNLGAGRVLYQDFTRITKAIQDGDFFDNSTLCTAVDRAVVANKAIHLLGLASAGGVHSHQEHLIAMLELAARRGAQHVYLHLFLDGRDTPPKSAQAPLEALENACTRVGVGRIATLIGRYYALDRDNRWERIQAAYELITEGHAEYQAETADSALQAAYERGESDEFVTATRIGKAAPITEGDVVIFMNFRADRARQLSKAFVESGFQGFPRRSWPTLADFVSLTQYAADLPTSCAFPPSELNNTLGDYLAQCGKTQLRIAETEKYAHVTFFFSGGREEPFVGEERILVASPSVATYDLKPEMSAEAITDQLIEAIQQQRFDLIIVNYANGDMVGHTGNLEAAIQAVECLDRCLGRVLDCLKPLGGEALITADHGNVEQMLDNTTGQAHTAHTCERVPFIYAGPRGLRIRSEGVLADVAPSLLMLLGLPQPPEMTGTNLLESVGC